jgi:tetratricopeptide (TPR) repeat protein
MKVRFHSLRLRLPLWGALTLVYSALVKFALWLPGVAIAVLIGALLIKSLTDRTIAIEPISVPKELADRGYTSEVAANRLHDAMTQFVATANSRIGTAKIALQGELPSINVPTVGISLDSILGSIRTLLGNTRHRSISGEFTVESKLLWLRLRMDGREFYSSMHGRELERPDDLLADATPAVFGVVQPYLVALSLSDKPAQALENAETTIAILPESDENVAWLYNLEGNLYRENKDNRAATKAFKKASDLSPRLAAPHIGLGLTLSDEDDDDSAITEYRTAIKLDPTFAIPHFNLGNILQKRGNLLGAIDEYHQAIALDPKYVSPHYNIANVLHKLGKRNEAIEEYRKAIAIGPNDPTPHNGLGVVLGEQGQADQAIAEFRRAIALNANDPAPHIGLVLILYQSKRDEAIDECRQAVALDPTNATTRETLERFLGKDAMCN